MHDTGPTGTDSYAHSTQNDRNKPLMRAAGAQKSSRPLAARRQHRHRRLRLAADAGEHLHEHESRASARQSADGAAERGHAAGSGRLLQHFYRGLDTLGDGRAHLWPVGRLEPLEPKE